jgi:hypothetical protein
MDKPLFDALSVDRMSSGHLNLNLSKLIPWEDFPGYASKVAKCSGGIIKDKADAPDMRIWTIFVNGTELRLVYDDYPQTISLESDSEDGDDLVRKLHQMFSSDGKC